MGEFISGSYEPKEVLHYFEEIAAIPHGSGNTGAISDYLAGFAEKQGLEYDRDKSGNVIIRKKGSAGCEDLPGVILQGHMDMVCEKEADCTVDMEKEGLKLVVEDGVLTADGTTLGGDDGIAVAYMLAVLADDSFVHPPLECVFTVDEEIGMLGADALDMSLLKGRMLINIDNEEEGHLITGCAGGCIVKLTLDLDRAGDNDDEDAEGSLMDIQDKLGMDGSIEGFLDGLFGEMNKTEVEFDTPKNMRLSISGLQGGHSGIEIGQERANACMLLGRALQMLKDELKYDYSIISVNGGAKDNAIPREASAQIRIDEEDIPEAEKLLMGLEKEMRHEYAVTDSGLKLSFEPDDDIAMLPMTLESGDDLITLLRIIPNGVQKMSMTVPGAVEASLNLGILKTFDDEVELSFLVRSSVESEKREMIGRLQAISELTDADIDLSGDYPGWEPAERSELSEIMCETYSELFGKQMVREAVHAGLECGIFSKGIPGLDIVSFGPDIKDIHTPNERMDLASVERTWKHLIAVLKKLAKK